jgi:hypothetical protein
MSGGGGSKSSLEQRFDATSRYNDGSRFSTIESRIVVASQTIKKNANSGETGRSMSRANTSGVSNGCA